MQFLLSKSLRRLSRSYSQAMIRAIPELYLETDADILLLPASSDEVCTQKEIAETLHFDKSRLAILIERLKQKGLIYTERNPGDRRAHDVFLTDHGREILPKIQEAVEQVNTIVNQQNAPFTLRPFVIVLQKIRWLVPVPGSKRQRSYK